MKRVKNLALVAHDNRKKDLVEWVEWNCRTLIDHQLICTGTTGQIIEKVIEEKEPREVEAMDYLEFIARVSFPRRRGLWDFRRFWRLGRLCRYTLRPLIRP